MSIQVGQVYADNSTDAGPRTIRVIDVATPRGPDYAHCVVETGKRPGSYTWIRVDRLSRSFTLITNKENTQ